MDKSTLLQVKIIVRKIASQFFHAGFPTEICPGWIWRIDNTLHRRRILSVWLLSCLLYIMEKNDILSSGRSGWCVPKGRPYYISSDIKQICLYRQLPNRRLSNRKRCNCRRIRKSIRSLRLWDRVPYASWTASNYWCLPIASTGSITPISSLLSFANELFVPIYNIRQLITIGVIKSFAAGIQFHSIRNNHYHRKISHDDCANNPTKVEVVFIRRYHILRQYPCAFIFRFVCAKCWQCAKP